MSELITVVIAGCGGRGRFAYAPYSKRFPEKMKIMGVADNVSERTKIMAETYDIPAERCYHSAEELFAQPKMADIAFICTQDRHHVRHACLAIEKGYDILLEKPISPDLKECKYLLRIAQEKQRHVTVCHVLRYTRFYQTLKQLIDSGAIGDIVNINACENVAYWHQAHSYVRGNWRRSDQSSPMILTKCSHDLDILLWLSGKECKTLSSFGSNYLFRSEKAPEGAAKRCMDGCKARDNCPYDCEKIYLDHNYIGFRNTPSSWMCAAICEHPSEEAILEALKNGPYGRCVYYCDNDVVDHQQVNMEMEDGSNISLSMCAFSSQCYRTIQIMGTKGEINGNMDEEKILVSRFGRDIESIDLKTDENLSGHGGGDENLLEDVLELAKKPGQKNSSLTSLDKSVASHYLALAAEESRLNKGEVIDMTMFIEQIPEIGTL